MAKKIYCSDPNQKARNGIKLCGSVNGIARKIVKGYCSDPNGFARVFWDGASLWRKEDDIPYNFYNTSFINAWTLLFGHYYLDKGVSESRRSGETESERTAMPNIIDYSSEEMRTFARKPFCSADSLILSFLSYVDMPKSIPVLSARKPHEKSEYRPSGKPPAKPSDFVSSPRAALNMVSRYLFGNDKVETEFKCARPAVMSELLRAEEFASMFNSYKNESAFAKLKSAVLQNRKIMEPTTFRK